MKNLKLLREARGLSQQKLADEFHLSQQSIYKYENDLAEPDFETLRKMAIFFHVSIDYLMGYSSDRNDSTTSIQEKEAPILTAKELHHLYLYRSLDVSMQNHVDSIMEAISGITQERLSH